MRSSVVAKAKKKAPDQDANFVFRGTIKQLNAANVKQAPVSDRTAIVTVNQVLDASANLKGYSGQDITVELSSARHVTAGERMIFHTTSWLSGETIAVKSLFEEPDKGAEATTHDVDAAAKRDQRKTSEHFDDADLVISGKVIEVRLPKDSSATSKKTAGGNQQATPVSEHDPKWREALIEVAEVHKGKSTKRQVVVRFPSSTDVAWRRAPKFEAGQQGYFMLHKACASGGPRRSASKNAKTAPDQTYAVHDAHDFQSYTEPGGIKSLIESDSVEE